LLVPASASHFFLPIIWWTMKSAFLVLFGVSLSSVSKSKVSAEGRKEGRNGRNGRNGNVELHSLK
jgi:hypothetical protein